MSLLFQLHPRITLVYHEPPDSEESVEDVVDCTPIDVPQDYIDIIREAGRAQFSVEMPGESPSYFNIWGADYCLDMNEAYGVEGELGEALGIGSNGRSEMLMLIPGATPPGLYRVPMGNMDIHEGSYICPSITHLLAHAENISRVWHDG